MLLARARDFPQVNRFAKELNERAAERALECEPSASRDYEMRRPLSRVEGKNIGS
jgi:hypothetical protein